MARKRPVVIGVTGGSGSGKTTVSHAIYDLMNGQSMEIITQDTYYNDQASMTMEERKAVNYDHPLAFDNDLLYQQLDQLRHNQAIEMPVYNYAEYTRSNETRHVEPPEDMVERGRSIESIIDQYLTTVKPMYHEFIEPTKRYADIIVPEGGKNQVAIDLLATKVRDILVQRGHRI